MGGTFYFALWGLGPWFLISQICNFIKVCFLLINENSNLNSTFSGSNIKILLSKSQISRTGNNNNKLRIIQISELKTSTLQYAFTLHHIIPVNKFWRKNQFCISNNAPSLEANIRVLLLLDCIAVHWVKVPLYWYPMKMHYGMCANGLLGYWGTSFGAHTTPVDGIQQVFQRECDFKID